MGSFYVLEVGVPGRPKCPDEYEDVRPGGLSPAVLICPRSRALIVQVSLKAVMVQLGIMDKPGSFEGSVNWQGNGRMWLPTTFALPRQFDAVRVRNYTPGEEAQVTLEAV